VLLNKAAFLHIGLAQFFNPCFTTNRIFMEQNQHRQATTQPQSGAEKKASPEEGCLPGNPQQTATEQNTGISQVDQQEGEMNHGELGGNFNNVDAKAGA
jgi:hypothetical protein